MKSAWPRGLLTALVTPIHGHMVHLPALKPLIELQIAAGASGVVVTGGTGEHGTLSVEERLSLIKATVEIVGKRVTVVAATGCLATMQSIELSQRAEQAGVDGLLIASPFGEPISWRERRTFYERINASVSTPIMVYNTPPAGLLGLDEIKLLAELDNISAVKDSSGNPELLGDLLAWAREEDFAVYLGKDSLYYEALLSGVRGAVFGAANFVPEKLVSLFNRIAANTAPAALLEEWRQLRPLMRFMERADNYVGMCKIGLRYRGIDVGDVRAPYLMPDKAEADQLGNLLKQLNVV